MNHCHQTFALRFGCPIGQGLQITFYLLNFHLEFQHHFQVLHHHHLLTLSDSLILVDHPIPWVVILKVRIQHHLCLQPSWHARFEFLLFGHQTGMGAIK
jgi:hypothetical protein